MGRPKGSTNKTRKPIEDLIGQTFNKWTVLSIDGRSPSGHVYYQCRCACGRERALRADVLKRGLSKSCGCSQFERFAHLYKDNQQRCPQCENWLPLHAYSKANQGKIGEPCRECRRLRTKSARLVETPERIREKTLRYTYGLSLTDFYKLAARQHNRCLCCQEVFEPLQLVVDHDHKTNTIRGLLCDNCNTVLGRVKESPSTLARLNAYLGRDITKLLVYVVGSLRNAHVTEVANELRQYDFIDAFDDYMAAGPEADDFWKAYEAHRGRDYKAALKGRAAGHVFHYDRAHIDLADAVIVVLPAGKSAMLEAGYSKARGKPVYFLLDVDADQGRYDVMKKFADGSYHSVNELIPLLHALYQETVVEYDISKRKEAA